MHLYDELRRRDLAHVLIAASDENTYDDATTTLQTLSPPAAQRLGIVNVHGYQYGGGRRDLLRDAVNNLNLYKPFLQPRTRLVQSEYGDGDASGMQMAHCLNLDMFWLKPDSFAYWQPFDVSGWGLIDTTLSNQDRSANLNAVNHKYYVFAHYSRHIRPGMQILKTGHKDVVGAYDPNNRQLVVVLTNNDDDRTCRLVVDLRGFNFEREGPHQRWISNNIHKYQFATDHTTLYDGHIIIDKFPPKTIQTFLFTATRK
jgi:galactan endo-1,6-beta-galactosidase